MCFVLCVCVCVLKCNECAYLYAVVSTLGSHEKIIKVLSALEAEQSSISALLMTSMA